MKFSEWNVEEYRVPSLHSDFRAAAELAGINADEVKHLMACVPGEADGPYWHWVYLLKDGSYGYMTGSCDYTGWDCQAGAHAITNSNLDDLFDVIEQGLDAWELRRFQKRQVKEQLKAQIEEKQAYAVDEVGE